MPRRLLLLFFAVIAIALHSGAHSAAATERRVALVIGNDIYKNARKLRNAVRDAKAVAAALDRLGFTVLDGYDRTGAQMRSLFRHAAELAASADVVLFYYSGHAFEFAGRNYLMPVDGDLGLTGDTPVLREQVTIDLNDILKSSGVGLSRINIVFLDACRDYTPATSAGAPPTRSTTTAARGLGRIDPGKAQLFQAYATDPGERASDGYGDHSPFSGALLNHIETHDITIDELMNRVKAEVRRETKGEQRPWANSSLTQSFKLYPSLKQDDIVTGGASEDCASMLLDAKRERDQYEAMSRVAARCAGKPEGIEAARLRMLSVDRKNCSRALSEPNFETLQGYLDSHPDGQCRDIVAQKLAALVGPRPNPPPEQPVLRTFDKNPVAVPQAKPAAGKEFAVARFNRDGELNLRAAPEPESEVLAKIPVGARGISWLGEEQTLPDGNRWVRIRVPSLGDATGWVNRKYLVEVSSSGVLPLALRFEMEPIYAVEFWGNRTREVAVSSFAECLITCLDDSKCKASEYYTAERKCGHFEDPPRTSPKQGAAVGFKRLVK